MYSTIFFQPLHTYPKGHDQATFRVIVRAHVRRPHCTCTRTKATLYVHTYEGHIVRAHVRSRLGCSHGTRNHCTNDVFQMIIDNENMSAIQIYFFAFRLVFLGCGFGSFAGLFFLLSSDRTSEVSSAASSTALAAQHSEICKIAFVARLACALEVPDRVRKSAEVNQAGIGGL